MSKPSLFIMNKHTFELTHLLLDWRADEPAEAPAERPLSSRHFPVTVSSTFAVKTSMLSLNSSGACGRAARSTKWRGRCERDGTETMLNKRNLPQLRASADIRPSVRHRHVPPPPTYKHKNSWNKIENYFYFCLSPHCSYHSHVCLFVFRPQRARTHLENKHDNTRYIYRT